MGKQTFKAPDGSHMCRIFYCDMRRERYCCYFCERCEKCEFPCLNVPEKCGEHFIQEEAKKDEV